MDFGWDDVIDINAGYPTQERVEYFNMIYVIQTTHSAIISLLFVPLQVEKRSNSSIWNARTVAWWLTFDGIQTEMRRNLGQLLRHSFEPFLS